MTVLTIDFFVFLFITFLVFYLLPYKLQWIWLLLSSIFFYVQGKVWYQILSIVVFLFINYIASLFITESSKYRSIIFRSVIVFDCIFFVVLKYPKFYYSFISDFLLKHGLEALNNSFSTFILYAREICPPYISYIGLIVIGYMCDVYWSKISLQKNPGKFLLFTSFFPQVVSGPIITYKDINNDLFGRKHLFSYEKTVRAIERIIWGAFKKLVIAERCAVIVNRVYEDYETYNGLYVPFAAVMFVAQLYSDFSGLMDIVIGTAELFDITLPENFDHPFLSTNLSEFWRRWHISLGEWLKNYVLFPIYRSKSFKKLNKWCKNKWGKHYDKKFNLPSYISLFISWFIIGLWHGGGWNYIFGVGIYMWLIIVLSDIFKPLFEKINVLLHINTNCLSFRLFQRVRTFIFYAFGLSFFRAETATKGFEMWKSGLSNWNPWIFVDHSLLEMGLDKLEWEICLIGILLMLIVSTIQLYKGSFRDTLRRQNFFFRVAVYVSLLMATIVFGYYGIGFNAESFIYGRF